MLHLFVATGGAPEAEGQRGEHHLLEHLVARGPDGDLSKQLELRGMYLSADTLRDGIRFEIEGPSDQLDYAVHAMREVMKPPVVTADEIKREAGVIAQEDAVRSRASRISAALWDQGFGAGVSDPVGVVADIEKVTPERIQEVHKELFQPKAMTVVVVGNVDVIKASTVIAEVFGSIEGDGEPAMVPRKPVEQTKEGFAPGVAGSGVGVYVGSFGKQDTLAVIAAAFALAGETPGAQAVYTPTPNGGLVSVVYQRRKDVDDTDNTIKMQGARLYGNGRATLLQWLDTADRSEREKARMYGQMMTFEKYFRLQDIRERATEITRSDFAAALNKFLTANSVRVGGAR